MVVIEHLFDNIDQALDFVLTEESYNLSQDKQRLKPPVEICIDEVTGMPRSVKTDSLESKYTAYFNSKQLL